MTLKLSQLLEKPKEEEEDLPTLVFRSRSRLFGFLLNSILLYQAVLPLSV